MATKETEKLPGHTSASPESNATPTTADQQETSLQTEGNNKSPKHSDGNDKDEEQQSSEAEEGEVKSGTVDTPPLPSEAPPLPAEAPPVSEDADDGWAPVWEASAQAFYFYNRFTGASQWTNPRVPNEETATVTNDSAPGTTTTTNEIEPPPPSDKPVAGGYNPAIHGDYDPTAWYAQPIIAPEADPTSNSDPAAQYAASAAFNRFTGRFQNSELNPENFNDENKSKRQMNAFFDVDAAANSHDGKSLKAERSGKKLTKTELKQFKEKRKAKKEEKRRAWLRD